MQQSLIETCPFCRKPVTTKEEVEENIMKRVEANDPNAMQQMGSRYFAEGEHSSAFEYFTKAAKLGDVEAHYKLGCCYGWGEGVEKDDKQVYFHLEEAAIGGHHIARYNLGCYERRDNRIERAIKHFIIAANQGFDVAIKELRGEYAEGRISKEDFAAALRAHQAASCCRCN